MFGSDDETWFVAFRRGPFREDGVGKEAYVDAHGCLVVCCGGEACRRPCAKTVLLPFVADACFIRLQLSLRFQYTDGPACTPSYTNNTAPHE